MKLEKVTENGCTFTQIYLDQGSTMFTNKRMTENIFQDNKENLNVCIICLTYIKTPKLNIITLKAYNKPTYLAPLAKGARRG